MDAVSKDSGLAPSGRASEADVIRLAIARGLDVLESEYGDGRPGRKAKRKR